MVNDPSAIQTETIIDKVTGLPVPNVGAEENRQQVEAVLLDQKGYMASEIAVDHPVSVDVNGQEYQSSLDLLVSVDGKAFLVIKCAAGSLGSREREVLASARVCLDSVPPLAAASDGTDWLVWDVNTGKQLGQGLSAVPERTRAGNILDGFEPRILEGKALARERLIFRSYDMDNVNVARKV